ncbi:MAG TPA: MarR family transcriptional regulator [Candidatus Limnocylindrales bacterium]|jgi:DNA-binding MarR family transcriptional regulator
MADKSSVRAADAPEARVSDGTLETSRLLVEFLHAAYATRRLDADPVTITGAPGTAHGAAPSAASSHAVRAAIHIYQHGERTVGQLASGLGISYGWASRVVEELEAYRYVTRERDPEDRRVVRVRLNPDALEHVERAYRWRGRAVEEALEPLSESEREAVRAFLRRLTGLLREGQPQQSRGAG